MTEETTCFEYLDLTTKETCMVVAFGLVPRYVTAKGSHGSFRPTESDFGIVDGIHTDALQNNEISSSTVVGSVSSILQAIQSSNMRSKLLILKVCFELMCTYPQKPHLTMKYLV